ncbi:hypothetical protein OQA88_9567 [Cercophora sp. LCS_1]
MPPPRLLQRRPRPSDSVASEGDRLASRQQNAPSLPPYEEPAHPLDGKAKNAVKELSSGRATRKYAQHVEHSLKHLIEVVGLLNDTLSNRKAKLAQISEKRQAKGAEKDGLETQLEEEVAQLETQATALNQQIEATVRTLIDYKAELEDEVRVINSVHATASAQVAPVERERRRRRERQPRAGGAAAGSDDDEPEDQEDEEMADVDGAENQTPIVGVKQMLREARRAQQQEYNRLTVQQRYARNNDYISFKRTWHDALHQDDHIPLADSSTWFDKDGNPVMDAAAQADEDDDLVVEREIIDLKCPLSLQVMKEPYSNRKCKHTFDKSAVLDYMQTNRGRAKCPVCSVELQTSDFYLDEFMLRKVKRALEAERRAEEEEELDVDMEGDDSVIAGPSRNIKKERNRGGRRAMEDVDEDSDAD